MKSTLFYSSSLFLIAGLISALPTDPATNPETVTIKVSSGDGVSARKFAAKINAIRKLDVKTVKSSLEQDKVWCGGFKDIAATDLWLNFNGADGIFPNGHDATYSIKYDGGVDSKPEDAIAVASYYCADSYEGVRKRVKKRTLPPREAQRVHPAPPPPPVNNPGAAPAPNPSAAPAPYPSAAPAPYPSAAPAPYPSAAPAPYPINNGTVPTPATVNIQIETERETTFFGETIAVNGQPQRTRQHAAFSLEMKSAHGVNAGSVHCQVIAKERVVAHLTAKRPVSSEKRHQKLAFDAIKCWRE